MIISPENELNICEIGTDATFKWNFFGIGNRHSFHEILYFKNNTEYRLLRIFVIRFNTIMDRYLHSDSESPFDRNRVAGFLHLDNGNGTLTVNITNVRYGDSGVFGFRLYVWHGNTRTIFNNNITLDVQSK